MMQTIAVVSPHLDDAALSVGGLLWLLQDHYRVEVITVFTADPPEEVSPVAAAMAAAFGPRISAIRRAEDAQALTTLGVGHRHLGFEDAVHRRTTQGTWVVGADGDLFRTAPEDALVEQVATALTECLAPEPMAGLLGPAGIGNHVDHLVTAAAIARTPMDAGRLAWIDLPYGATERRSEPRLRVPLPPAAWRAKVAAIRCYETQLAELYPGHGDLDSRMIRMSGGTAEWFALSTLDAEPELLPLIDGVLNWYGLPT